MIQKGTYFETIDNWIGYITECEIGIDCVGDRIIYLQGVGAREGKIANLDMMFAVDDISRHFNRLGEYNYNFIPKSKLKYGKEIKT